jgi:hypothetical protein
MIEETDALIVWLETHEECPTDVKRIMLDTVRRNLLYLSDAEVLRYQRLLHGTQAAA